MTGFSAAMSDDLNSSWGYHISLGRGQMTQVVGEKSCLRMFPVRRSFSGL